MAQNRAGEFGEEALDEVEPRAVLSCEGKFEATGRTRGQPGSGFSRDVRGMIVEDQLDRGAGRIGSIEKLEKLDELPATVAVFDEGVDLPGEQINPGQQTIDPAYNYLTFCLECGYLIDDSQRPSSSQY